MSEYNHAKFVERLTDKAKKYTRASCEVIDLGNDAVAYVTSGVDEIATYNPETDEERRAIERGNYPFYVTVDVFFKGVELGGGGGYCYGDRDFYIEVRDEMIAAIDVHKMRFDHIQSLRREIEQISLYVIHTATSIVADDTGKPIVFNSYDAAFDYVKKLPESREYIITSWYGEIKVQ